MRFTRSTRRWLSGWLIGALLCMQWAVAAYACPQLRALGLQSVAQAIAASADMPPDCPGMSEPQMDPAAPQLCQIHCDPCSHAFQLSHADLSVDLAAAQWVGVLDWQLAVHLPIASTGSYVDAVSTGPPPGWPPLFLSLLVLRN